MFTLSALGKVKGSITCSPKVSPTAATEPTSFAFDFPKCNSRSVTRENVFPQIVHCKIKKDFFSTYSRIVVPASI